MLKPSVLCELGRLSATNALKGSMATLKEASITITIPAPIHNAGITPAIPPELGKKTRAAEDNNAPVKK